MKIHKPAIFYLFGVGVGILAHWIGPWWGTGLFLAGVWVGVWLDARTVQMD